MTDMTDMVSKSLLLYITLMSKSFGHPQDMSGHQVRFVSPIPHVSLPIHFYMPVRGSAYN